MYISPCLKIMMKTSAFIYPTMVGLSPTILLCQSTIGTSMDGSDKHSAGFSDTEQILANEQVPVFMRAEYRG